MLTFRQPDGPPALSTATINQLVELEQFLGGKDEAQLRETFDFENMLNFNLIFVRDGLTPNTVSEEEREETKKYFEGGNGMASTKYSILEKEEHGPLWYRPAPGRLGLMNTSKKYADSLLKLRQFEDSSFLPSDIRGSLKAVDEGVVANKNLLIDVLNQEFKEDPNNIIFSADIKSPYYEKAAVAYWEQFSPIKPQVDVLLERIEKHTSEK